MKDIRTLEEYERRIVEILSADDITVHFDEMLSIGARIINGLLGYEDKKILAQRVRNQIIFDNISGLNDSLRYVAYLHLMARLEEDAYSFEKLIYFISNMTIEYKYRIFLLTQARHMAVMNPALVSQHAHNMYRKAFKKVVLDYKNSLDIDFNKISKKDRNPNKVIVLTQQYLNQVHEPTKLCNQVAEILMKDMNKEIMLINTNDLLPVGHMVPLFGIEGQNSLQFMESMDYTQYNGNYIPYFQCGKKMPDENEMTVVLNTIISLKPEYIITMNRYSLMGALSSCIVPTMNIEELGNNSQREKIHANLERYQEQVREGLIYNVKVHAKNFLKAPKNNE